MTVIYLWLLRFRLLLLPFLFLSTFLVYVFGYSVQRAFLSDSRIPRDTALLAVMNTVSDGRIRLAKLERTSVLGPVSMWVAFPSEEKIVPGTSWYQTIWDKNDLDGVRFIDEILSISPCQQHPEQIFIQIGAHLGIFPLFAAYRGCRAIAVEGMPAASNFSKISALINGWEESRFRAINAAVSHKNGYVLFDITKISMSLPTDKNKGHPGLVRVPMLTMDSIDQQYGRNRVTGKSDIAFVVIDVEGFEQEVLLGAKKLIKHRSVQVFQIEVWTSLQGKGKVLSFPGLELLTANGYKLFSPVLSVDAKAYTCEDLTNRLDELPQLFERRCQHDKVADGNCLAEILAVRPDVPPLKRWATQC